MAKRGSLAHIAYVVTIAIKGFDGALETILGCTIALTGPDRIYALLIRFSAPELYEDHSHHVMRLIRHGASQLAESNTRFVISYLLIHGVLKLVLAVVLLRGGGRWIFPVATLILVSFIGYMSWHLAERWSGWVFGFALFDLLTLALVLIEWRNRARR